MYIFFIKILGKHPLGVIFDEKSIAHSGEARKFIFFAPFLYFSFQKNLFGEVLGLVRAREARATEGVLLEEVLGLVCAREARATRGVLTR